MEPKLFSCHYSEPSSIYVYDQHSELLKEKLYILPYERFTETISEIYKMALKIKIHLQDQEIAGLQCTIKELNEEHEILLKLHGILKFANCVLEAYDVVKKKLDDENAKIRLNMHSCISEIRSRGAIREGVTFIDSPENQRIRQAEIEKQVKRNLEIQEKRKKDDDEQIRLKKKLAEIHVVKLQQSDEIVPRGAIKHPKEKMSNFLYCVYAVEKVAWKAFDMYRGAIRFSLRMIRFI
jgi:hypothetical protein